MTYQPESVGKNRGFLDFDPLHLPKSKSNVYLFLQGLSCRVLSVLGKKLDSVFKLILLPTSREIHV